MATIRILLLGGGGREHSLAWRLSKSTLVDRIYVCPGNGGTFEEPKTTNLDLSASDFPQLAEWAVAHEVRRLSKLLFQRTYSLTRLLLLSLDQSNLW